MRTGLGRATTCLAVVALVSLAGCFNSSSGTVNGNAFAANQPYSKLLVEIDYVQGKNPSRDAVSLLKQRATERLSKPDGVVDVQEAFASSKTTYSVDDLKSLESQHRTNQAAGNQMVLYVLYLNGNSNLDTSDNKVLGIQYGRASIAIFKDSINNCGVLPVLYGCSDVERSVLVHEFGHTVGLVNNGLKMVRDHEDAANKGHSTNSQSVMYWRIDTTLGLKELTGNIPNDFDADDRADIQAAGGKA